MAGIVFFVLVAIAVMAIFVLSTRRIARIWSEAAGELGIELESASFGHPRIGGIVDGIVVLVDVKGNGDNARTRYRTSYPPLNPEFRLKREAGTQKIMRALGVSDVEIGEAEFDDAFDVSTDQPDALRALLTPSRRYGLLRLFAMHKNVIVTESSFEVTSRRVASDPEAMVSTVRRLVATSQLMLGTASTASLDAALAARAAGDLGAALETLDEVVSQHPGDVEAKILQAETALSLGDRERAEANAEAAHVALPGDPEVAGIRDAVRSIGVPAPAQPAAASASPTSVDTDSSEMFDDLFGRSRLSFESDRRFDEAYRGREVRWTGPVRTTRAYETDLDFGRGPGTKAVVRVASISSDLYGNTEVDAVVALPAGLKLDRGDVITFTGTLHRVDAMMRNVFVTDGRIE